MADGLLIYGANGYVGTLIAQRAVAEGLSPTLAGRRAEPVEALATELDTDHQVFSLAHAGVVERRVADVDAVLNCAGPFTRTAEPLVTACLAAGTDYLDVAGSVDVLEAHAERDATAEKHGIALLPGVGHDVVATDCLAASLHGENLDATRLTMAVDELGTFSPGTLKSIIVGLDRPGVVREHGDLRTVPMAWKRRQFTFEGTLTTAVTVPWGEVSTGFYTTGIPNIETYATVPDYAAALLERARPLTPVLQSPGVQAALERLVDVAVSGPSADERSRSETHVYGEVVDDAGERATARLRTPDTYDTTAMIAVEAARRTLEGEVDAGFSTPASAFGPEFVLEFDGIHREDAALGHDAERRATERPVSSQ